MSDLYTSRLDQIGDALAAHIAAAPALAAEECEVISQVDDSIGSILDTRVAKAGGLVCLVALMTTRSVSPGAPGPRVVATWNLSLWMRRTAREGRNAAVTLYEAMLARAQGWQPEGTLCYDAFELVTGGQQPHKKYIIYEATFSAQVQLAPPALAPIDP